MRPALLAALLAGALAVGSAARAALVLDFTVLGPFSDPFLYRNCAVVTRASDDLHVNAGFGGPGIAVQGNNNGSIDGGESVSFEFSDDVSGLPLTATEVTYAVEVALGVSDGDAVPAEVSIEAFAPGDVSLGSVPFSGTGDRSVSGAFGNVPIAKFVLTGSPDAVRVLRIGYALPEGTLITVTPIRGGPFQVETLDLCGVSFDGSNMLNATPFVSLGVVGGSGTGLPDRTIDTGETLEVALAEPAEPVSYHISSSFRPQAATGVTFEIEAFDESDASLGSVQLTTDGPDIPVSSYFAGSPLSRFVIQASPDGEDGQGLGSVQVPVPEPTATLLGVGALAAIAAVRAGHGRARRRPRPRTASAASAVSPPSPAGGSGTNRNTSS